MKIFFKNTLNTKRRVDENGFLIAEDCAILRSGILNYKGTEIGKNTNDIKKAYLSDEELEKGMDSAILKPVLKKHDFVGSVKGGKEKPIGSLGDNLRIEKREDGYSYLIGNISITDEDAVEEILTHKREQLSSGYTGDLIESNNPDYDYEVKNIVFNHIALCKRGRCGDKVCISNSDDDCFLIKEGEKMEEKNFEEKKEEILENECGKKITDEEKKEVKKEEVEEKKIENEEEKIEKKEEKKIEEKDEEKEIKDEDKKDLKNSIEDIKLYFNDKEYTLEEVFKVLLEEVEYHKEHPVNQDTEKIEETEEVKEKEEIKKDISNSIDDIRVQVENEIKEENSKKISFYNSVKEYTGNIEILNYDMSELADKTCELLKINLKNNLSVNEKISFVNGYVEGLKANSYKDEAQNSKVFTMNY